MALFGPESTVALIRLTVAIALILLHHLGERGKRGGGRGFPFLPRSVNGGDLTRNGRETEAIYHQMMIPLIPVPVAFSHPISW